MILDGAMGTELQARGVPMDGEVWSAKALLTHADAVQKLHEDYIRVGADIIITNTFSASRNMLGPTALGDKVREINLRAVELARRARDQSAGARDVWIAGAISPMATGGGTKRLPGIDEAARNFREQAELLAKAGVDVILLEMLRDVAYASAAVDAAASAGLPVWVGFSCRQKSGTLVMHPVMDEPIPFRDVIGPILARGGSLVAVMHTEVHDTTPGLEMVRKSWSGPLGAYPNSGYFTMPNWQFVDIISPEAFLGEAARWVASGVQVVGGCCGIGPDHIRMLKERLPSRLA